jgi:hypothetical protein
MPLGSTPEPYPSACSPRGRAEAGPYARSPLACMDDRHHHLVSHHRHLVVEVASQRLGGSRHDESEEDYDVGNPYTRLPTRSSYTREVLTAPQDHNLLLASTALFPLFSLSHVSL